MIIICDFDVYTCLYSSTFKHLTENGKPLVAFAAESNRNSVVAVTAKYCRPTSRGCTAVLSYMSNSSCRDSSHI